MTDILNESALIEPIDLVKISLDEEVFIKCKGNRELSGILHAFDSHLNMVLGNVEETLSYLETDPNSLEETLKVVKRNFDMLYIRGDVVILLSPMAK